MYTLKWICTCTLYHEFTSFYNMILIYSIYMYIVLDNENHEKKFYHAIMSIKYP